jgi:hypothetical protein
VTGHRFSRSGLRVVEGGSLPMNAVERLHKFQAEQPTVKFNAPHMGGHGRYAATIPAGTIPGDPREITATCADLTGLMDQLDDLFGSPGQ